ncbi:MAG: OmpA family protein [Bacteroidetes bacterium]|nr:OmpA family protein [Bacteroidota bacterium]
MELKVTVTIQLILQVAMVSAQNLVLNPSFEDLHNCPKSHRDFKSVKYWSSPNSTYGNIYNLCNTFGKKQTVYEKKSVVYYYGKQAARTGDGFAGIVVYSINSDGTMMYDFREYLQTEFKSPLVSDSIYEVQFYVSLGDSSQYSIKHIGCFFSEKKLRIGDKLPISNLSPVLCHSSDSNYIDNRESWIPLKGMYKAGGGEKYLIIGNFFDNKKTDKRETNISKLRAAYNNTYYFIDDVSVYKLDKSVGENRTHHLLDHSFTVKNIQFEIGSFNLNQISMKRLNDVTELLKDNPDFRIEIIGHTDDEGSLDQNMTLSTNRAKVVADYLIKNGINDSRLNYKGKGSLEPTSENNDIEGRQKNRRVEFHIR